MIAVQITSGQGPVECQWVVARVREAMVAEAVVQGIQVHDVDICSGDVQGCLRSCSLLLDGGKEETVANQWVGTIQWIGKSLFRPQHRRRNWFVGIDVFLLPERIEWSAEEVQVASMSIKQPQRFARRISQPELPSSPATSGLSIAIERWRLLDSLQLSRAGLTCERLTSGMVAGSSMRRLNAAIPFASLRARVSVSGCPTHEFFLN
jgi:hypothetical protein